MLLICYNLVRVDLHWLQHLLSSSSFMDVAPDLPRAERCNKTFVQSIKFSKHNLSKKGSGFLLANFAGSKSLPLGSP